MTAAGGVAVTNGWHVPVFGSGRAVFQVPPSSLSVLRGYVPGEFHDHVLFTALFAGKDPGSVAYLEI